MANHHAHHAPHSPTSAESAPVATTLSSGAGLRLAVAAGAIALLWLTVLWALS